MSGTRLQPIFTALLAAGLVWLGAASRLSAENVRFRHLGVEDGLSHTTVWDVHQDRRGFVWIATETSLQRYDGYELKSYRFDPDDATSLSGSEVMYIHEDRRGRLWLATRNQGVNRYDRLTDSFVRYPPWPGVEDLRIPYMIRAISDDAQGTLWIGSFSGLVRLDPESGETQRYFPRDGDPESLGHLLVYAVLVDREGNVWAGLHNGVDRLQHPLQPESERIVHYRPAPEAADPYANAVVALHEDPQGRLWCATHDGYLHRYDREADSWSRAFALRPGVNDILTAPDGRMWVSTHGNGLFRVDPASGETETFVHDPGDAESLVSDKIFHLDLDHSGLLWVGTREGISIHDPQRSRFRLIRGKGAGNVTALLEDRSGTLWIGFSSGELVARDPVKGIQEPFPFAGGPKLGAALALLESSSGVLWGGFDLGLARIDRAAGGLASDSAVEPGVAVRSLAEDLRGDLWVGTFGGGLIRLDPATGATETPPVDPRDPAALPSKRVYTLTVDRAGRVWAGFEEGLSRIDPETGAITTWRHDPARPESLGLEGLADLYEDRAGRLWIATYGGGLDRYEAARDSFHHYREKDGLASNNVVGILEDDDGRLWLSTNEGLSRFDPETGAFRNYDVDDGLASNVFLIGGRLRLRNGDLVVGGDGLVSFAPAELEDDPVAPQVAITELLIEGSPVEPGAPGSPLEQAVAETRELVLDHRQASFSLEFAALHFSAPGKNRYAFRLEGYDSEWIETDAGHRRARYTHPDPGTYVFRVKASNQDGVWNEEGAALSVRILPPPWRTWWAYALYVLAAAAGAFAYDRSNRRRLERERQVNARLREVDRLKDEFMANTSHELRTPLYGITGLAESLCDGVHGALPEAVTNDLSMIVDSGRRLTGLVNDILDYSRLRDRELDLSLKPLDVNTVVGLVLTLMRPLAQGKELRLTNAVAEDLPAVEADENRLQQILVNLVGNAIKFTDRGEIAVGAEVDGDEARIVVSDTGLGIAAVDLERIFEPFEQIHGAADRRFSGTGLGLAVTRHLVELHGGRLEVRSTPGEGSSFSFSLPLAPPEAAAKGEGVGPPKPVLAPVAPGAATFSPPRLETAGGVPTILVVDDEQVVLQVLANQLGQAGYRSLQAASGPEALALLEERRPDLVLLDIMMPRMSGFEVCRKIRQRFSLDELPVIYLTARSRVEDLVQGFSTGASDFLSKPITRDELLSRVRLHLELKRLYKNLEELVEKRTDQLKTVTGLLPICASCKKIRDDDGYWNELEVYLSTHSDAQLTHGLCYDCARRMYPEIDLSEAPQV